MADLEVFSAFFESSASQQTQTGASSSTSFLTPSLKMSVTAIKNLDIIHIEIYIYVHVYICSYVRINDMSINQIVVQDKHTPFILQFGLENPDWCGAKLIYAPVR